MFCYPIIFSPLHKQSGLPPIIKQISFTVSLLHEESEPILDTTCFRGTKGNQHVFLCIWNIFSMEESGEQCTVVFALIVTETSLCSLAGRYDNPICSTGPPGYIGRGGSIPWNRFLSFWNVYKFGLWLVGGGGGIATPSPHTRTLIAGSVTIRAKTTVHCSPGSSMRFSQKFLVYLELATLSGPCNSERPPRTLNFTFDLLRTVPNSLAHTRVTVRVSVSRVRGSIL